MSNSSKYIGFEVSLLDDWTASAREMRESVKLQVDSFKVFKNESGLLNVNLRGLGERLRDLAVLRDTAFDPEEIRRYNREIERTQQSMAELRQDSARGGQENPGDSLSGLGKTIAAVFAVDKIKDFGSEVIGVLSSFENYDAALTSALGSESKAKKAMDEIKTWALDMPSEVDDITRAYVKLTNINFKPTRDQYVAMEDFTRVSMKSMDDYVEMVKDAEMGQFKRMQDFSIGAEKKGDKIAFTYRGITTEVNNNSQAIRNYLVGLGQLDGIAGVSERMVKTVGGQISNLSDQFTQFKLSIGEAFKPLITYGVSALSKTMTGLQGLVGFIRENSTAFKVFAITIGGAFAAMKTFSAALAIGEALTAARTAMTAFRASVIAAKTAQDYLNLSMRAFPAIAIAGLIATVGISLWNMKKATDEATMSAKLLNNVRVEAAAKTGEEQAKLESLLSIAKNETISKAERKRAIDELNKVSPEYLGNLSLENVNTAEAVRLTNEYIGSLERKALAEIVSSEHVEAVRNRRAAEKKLEQFQKDNQSELDVAAKVVKRNTDNISYNYRGDAPGTKDAKASELMGEFNKLKKEKEDLAYQAELLRLESAKLAREDFKENSKTEKNKKSTQSATDSNTSNPIADATTKKKGDSEAGGIGGGTGAGKNITINIQNLNEGGITVMTTKLDDAAPEIKNKLIQLLLDAVNDANNI